MAGVEVGIVGLKDCESCKNVLVLFKAFKNVVFLKKRKNGFDAFILATIMEGIF